MTTPHPLFEDWLGDEIATEQDLLRLEEGLNASLPSWYKRFVVEIGSGEGSTADGCVILYRASSLLAMHAEEENGFRPLGLFLFGTNGGGEAFTFDLRASSRDIVMFQFVSNYLTDGVVIGRELDDLLDYSNRFGYPRFNPER